MLPYSYDCFSFCVPLLIDNKSITTCCYVKSGKHFGIGVKVIMVDQK